MEPENIFGMNLRNRRLALGWSQERLADESGLHATEISRLERAAREPRLSTMARLAKALDTPLEALVRGI